MDEIIYSASGLLDANISQFNEKIQKVEGKLKELKGEESVITITANIQECLSKIAKIESEYSKVLKKINSYTISPMLDLKNVDVGKLNKLKDGKLQSFAKDLQASFDQLSNTRLNNSLATDIDNLAKGLQKLKRLNNLTPNQQNGGMQPFFEDLEKLTSRLRELDNITIPDFSKLNITKTNVKNLGELSTALGNIREALVQFDSTATGALDSISKLVGKMDGLKNLSSILKNPKALENIANVGTGKNLSTSGKIANDADATLMKQAQSLDTRIEKWLQRNTAASAEFREELKKLQQQLRATGGISKADYDNIYSTFLNIDRATVAAGRNTSSFFMSLRSGFASAMRYASTFTTFYDFIRYFRQGIQIVKDYDKAFIGMKKVSHDALSELRTYQEQSYVTANKIATTGLQLQQSAADWMRLGESIKEAKKSAEQTSILFNVAEFENVNDATDGLIAVSQAYKDMDKARIVDVLNNVGNNFAVSTEGLTQALQRSAAVLSTQGNDIYKAAALITAGNSIVQNPEMTGAGIRTIALRIAGTKTAKEELDALGESTEDYIVQTKSKTDETIKAYTKTASNLKGVSVLDDNGNLRETYDILLDISKVYKEIQEEDKKAGTNRAQALVEFLAGKNRSNIAASILTDPTLLEDAYKTALDSEGSAQRELESQINSVEGQLKQLTNAAHEFWTTFLNSGVMTFLANVGEGLLNVGTNITKLGDSVTTIGGKLNAKAGGGGAITMLGTILGSAFMIRNGVGWQFNKINANISDAHENYYCTG